MLAARIHIRPDRERPQNRSVDGPRPGLGGWSSEEHGEDEPRAE